MSETAATSALLEPLRLGPLVARNRIVFASHVTNLAEDGLPGERFAAYVGRRAAGGVGLVVLEEAQVHPTSHPYQRAIRGYDPAIVPAWRRLAARLRSAGALAVAQLNHAGMQGTGRILKLPLWAPSAVPNAATLEMPKAMEPEDVAEVVAGFAAAARHAVAGGLDGVEVNAGQHSLVRQFLSGLTNVRGDRYGGDPERRLTFAREVLRAVRAAMGPDAVLGLRLCGDELAPWAGITPEQAPELAAALTDGVDYVSVVVGSIYSVHATRAGMHQPPGYALDLAAAVRARLENVPVLASGSLVDPEQASAAVAGGRADACEMTRALIADPDLPAKLAAGRRGAVRPCIRCNQDCVVRGAANAEVSCIHNPEAGHEWAPCPALPQQVGEGVGRAVRQGGGRRVVVVGGGPAGMEAARSAALAGHRVTLLERAPALGGVPRLVAESGQRRPFGLVSSWLEARLAELEVEVRLGTEATPALLEEIDPELVVVATGARPRPTPAGALSVREVLAGRLPGRGRVVVVDRQGWYPAIDAARLAAERGRPVTLVTEDAFCSSQLGATGELSPWYQAAAALGIELRPMATVVAIEPGGLRLRHRFAPVPSPLAGEGQGVPSPLVGEGQGVPSPLVGEGQGGGYLEADCVVVADFELPEDALYRELAGRLPVRRAGDCVAPRRVLHAILEGGRAVREPVVAR